MFPEKERVIYERNPIFEVVAQLRYPTILSIGIEIPAKFQEAVWEQFPIVESGQAVNVNINLASGQDVRQVKNVYDFYTPDRMAKLTLTDEFIALTVRRYTRWEEFSSLISVGLRALVSVYKVPFFTRIGLRYIDFIDREKLGLTTVSWSDLIKPSILGVLNEPDLVAQSVKNSVTNFLYVGDDCQCAFNCGLPNMEILDGQNKKVAESGNLLVLDTDFFSPEGQINAKDALPTLNRYNQYTRNAFRWAIQEQLHQALGPNRAS